MTHGYRTYPEQHELYSLGRTKPGRKVTNSKPGESMHNFGLAFDICFKGDDPYLDKLTPKDSADLWLFVGSIGKSIGLHWGGDFSSILDKPHFEYRPRGVTSDDLFALHERGGIALVFKKIDQLCDPNYTPIETIQKGD